MHTLRAVSRVLGQTLTHFTSIYAYLREVHNFRNIFTRLFTFLARIGLIAQHLLLFYKWHLRFRAILFSKWIVCAIFSFFCDFSKNLKILPRFFWRIRQFYAKSNQIVETEACIFVHFRVIFLVHFLYTRKKLKTLRGTPPWAPTNNEFIALQVGFTPK